MYFWQIYMQVWRLIPPWKMHLRKIYAYSRILLSIFVSWSSFACFYLW